MLKYMMHRSDNFYAEQTLLMISNELLGYMKDAAVIDTLLKTDLKDLPQHPSWVDGSGLSRFNLFTPQDFITLLLKIKNTFGLNRIRNILPAGNTGTLEGLYISIGNNIAAKTGTLSGQVGLSGYLVCKSGKLLVFSVLVNNHHTRAQAVRKAVEKFISDLWAKY
jgi:D-alanyl-D-alanine carboxypeptidase/D-alanyl-D-alanine-endopeptidase (penicillin-binding protein 4)